MNRRFLLTSAGAMIAAGGGWQAVLAQETTTADAATDTAATDTADAGAVARVTDMVLGAEDAPITLMEYGSFTCPHCAAFHQEVFLPLKRDYIDTGKVRFVYRELVRNRFDIWASMLVRCGGDVRYFGMSELVFTQQAEWSATGDPAQIAEALRKMGKVAGFDDATLDACMTDATLAQEILDFSTANAEADEITGTPTLFIDGEKVPNGTYEQFKALLDEKLAE